MKEELEKLKAKIDNSITAIRIEISLLEASKKRIDALLKEIKPEAKIG